MSAPWLFWHRRDLRLADNLGLARLAAHTHAVTGLVVLESSLWEGPAAAPSRLWFLLDSVAELQQAWRRAGSQLLVLRGDPLQHVPQLAARLGVAGLAWNEDVEPAPRRRDDQLERVLLAQGIAVQRTWDQLLAPPEQIKAVSGEPYKVYGPYRRAWFNQPKATPVAPPHRLTGTDPMALSAAAQNLPLLQQLPTPAELGCPWRGRSPCRPGERAARQQLDAFVHGPLSRYDPERNYPGRKGTSCLGAALRFGTIGPRTLWQASREAMDTRGQESVEAQQAITVWQQELAWREFYQQALFHFPALESGAFRPRWRQFPWRNQPDHFAAWCEGRTGYPIVDAAMAQLVQTGWMHNRCRMIVASFLTKDLICDWRWGEAFFMQHLVDGDLAANNGGWQWSASSGMDPRPLRIFNPSAQAARFDEDGDYIRRWLPELASCATADLLSGRIAPLERRGYPEPIVDHRQQQARFRQMYATHVRG